MGVAALAVAFFPRRKTPPQRAALTATLVAAFELTLTHRFALYIVWFLPFVLLATVAGAQLQDAPIREVEHEPSPA